MVTAGICFLFLAVRCLWRRFPLAKCVGIAITAMICLLSLFPMDGFVAQYNVNAYLSGHTETEVDYYYLKTFLFLPFQLWWTCICMSLLTIWHGH